MRIEHATWIRADEHAVAPVFYKEVTVNSTEHASIEICGLGFFELYVNGKKVGDDYFVPSCSDYTERDLSRAYYPIYDTMEHIVYYKTYSLSDYLKQGGNRIEILLGDGWYRQTMRTAEGAVSFGIPCLIFSLFADGKEYLSDETVLWRESHITFQNIFFGEKQDHTRPLGAWQRAFPAEAPTGMLAPDPAPADKLIRTITPRILKSENGVTLYDAGENISGFVSFRGGAFGELIKLTFAECLYDDMTLNEKTGGGHQNEEYICDGTDRVYHPHFCYHGFRYFEISGNVRDVTVCVVHADVKRTSSFSSDHPILQFLYDATVRSLLSNLHGGVISDCPHRERLGYTGDGQITADVALLLLDAEAFYRKWMRDIALGQDKKTGHVQHTAPLMGGGGGPGGWGSAIVTVPYMLYRHSGELKILEQYFPNMLLWVAYMEAHSENGLVVREEEKGWCLRDWCTPEKVILPEPFVNTYFLIKSLSRMAEIAALLGKDNTPYLQKAETIKTALVETYYDKNQNTFCGGVQGADAFAADIGLGNRAMLDKLAEKYDALGEFDTGIFGTDILIRILFENGYADTALTLMTSEKGNSFGTQYRRGETTLCENWNHDGWSHNHHMFGQMTAYLFRYLLGIQISDHDVMVCPAEHTKTLSVKGALQTRFGKITVERNTTESADTFTILSELQAMLCYRGQAFPITKNEEMTVTILR